MYISVWACKESNCNDPPFMVRYYLSTFMFVGWANRRCDVEDLCLCTICCQNVFISNLIIPCTAVKSLLCDIQGFEIAVDRQQFSSVNNSVNSPQKGQSHVHYQSSGRRLALALTATGILNAMVHCVYLVKKPTANTKTKSCQSASYRTLSQP